MNLLVSYWYQLMRTILYLSNHLLLLAYVTVGYALETRDEPRIANHVTHQLVRIAPDIEES